jgi:hypothetical protein
MDENTKSISTNNVLSDEVTKTSISDEPPNNETNDEKIDPKIKRQLYKKEWANTNRQKIVEAKRRFYDKMKNNPEFMENIRLKAKERYRLKREAEGKEVKPKIPVTEKIPIEKKPCGRPRVHP